MPARFFALVLLALAVAGSVLAQPFTPAYAIYGIRNTDNQVTSINVGVIPTGSQAECLRQIEVYETGMRKRGLPAHIQLVPSKCTSELSADFQRMVDGHPIKDAYVVVIWKEWAPIFNAWYNLSPSDPTEVCKTLVDNVRMTIPPRTADIDCRHPL